MKQLEARMKQMEARMKQLEVQKLAEQRQWRLLDQQPEASRLEKVRSSAHCAAFPAAAHNHMPQRLRPPVLAVHYIVGQVMPLVGS
jgi:TolA-binding protein